MQVRLWRRRRRWAFAASIALAFVVFALLGAASFIDPLDDVSDGLDGGAGGGGGNGGGAPPRRFDEAGFRARVQRALTTVKQLLDTTRKPALASPEQTHAYSDKYVLADFTTNTAVLAELNVLEGLGLSVDALQQLLHAVHAQQRTVTLRWSSDEQVVFERTATRDVESPSHITSWLWGLINFRSKRVTTVTEHFYRTDITYQLVAYVGAGRTADTHGDADSTGDGEPAADYRFTLQKRMVSIPMAPRQALWDQPFQTTRQPLEVDLTWVLRHLRLGDDGLRSTTFAIDRSDSAQCHTPRRNPQVDGAVGHWLMLFGWARAVRRYCLHTLLSPDAAQALDVAPVFVPVIPLFDSSLLLERPAHRNAQQPPQNGTSAASPVPVLLSDAFLSEQRRVLFEKRDALSTGKYANRPHEMWMVTLVNHLKEVAESAVDAVDYVEAMLYAQLKSAIGKELQPLDFQHYTRFHMQKLYREQYQPRPFSYAVRRPTFDPEGMVSIEAEWDDDSASDPIHTVVSSARVPDANGESNGADAAAPMFFALDASTRVQFGGERYVHGWINQQFSGSSGLRLSLVARARQFSSFVLMVGRIGGASTFEPKHALIIQNKDDLRIPLMLETIPTPKEFRDAIESLSPEQQRFAKGYRAMQLESTLFAVCIVQIKPALEKVLNLPDDALTKEIELTQDLLQLFIEYQIPTDLLSYSPNAVVGAGAVAASAADRVNVVRGFVSKMKEMIKSNKLNSLGESAMGASHAVLESLRGGHPEAAYDSVRPKIVPMTRAYSSRTHLAGAAVPAAAAAYTLQVPQSAAAPAPSPQTPPPLPPQEGQQQQQQQKQPQHPGEHESDATAVGAVDYTEVPKRLEDAYERLDTDGALRPTIVNAGNVWSKTSLKSLLASPTTAAVDVTAQGKERSRAFDLIDALTKSGDLTLDHAALHVFIAATHCFDKTLVDTVIQQNVNPIERVERSSLIVASTIHGVAPQHLVQPSQLPRLAELSPHLIPNEAVSTASTDGVLTSATGKSPAAAATASAASGGGAAAEADDNLLPLPV